MVDLDQLSREVAAAGSDWMMPGVQVVTPDGESLLFLGRKYGAIIVLGKPYGIASTDIRPNLRDPVTVNAMLGNGQAWRRIIGGGVAWVASVDLVHERTEDDRTAAICRAWIAARGKK